MHVNKMIPERTVQGTTYEVNSPNAHQDKYSQNDRSPLFPNVDPTSIGQHRPSVTTYSNPNYNENCDNNSMLLEPKKIPRQ